MIDNCWLSSASLDINTASISPVINNDPVMRAIAWHGHASVDLAFITDDVAKMQHISAYNSLPWRLYGPVSHIESSRRADVKLYASTYRFRYIRGLIKVKVKVWTLVTAEPLTRVRLVTSSALQSRKWQLIGISQW